MATRLILKLEESNSSAWFTNGTTQSRSVDSALFDLGNNCCVRLSTNKKSRRYGCCIIMIQCFYMPISKDMLASWLLILQFNQYLLRM
ncbi:hypothetical protein HID58_015815 [Brassica napus]|uniref:Uncharacterized protein n=3 Tax=Brassica TaxID=3705 RepID=A0ABQ8DLA0_BRANA|nr:hypothetical protein HID58_015815 [Brassica napus]CDY47872.1 BnaA07g14170D [Brassica napus]VDC98702.1 unnamed protein product [Brassica rapa]